MGLQRIQCFATASSGEPAQQFSIARSCTHCAGPQTLMYELSGCAGIEGDMVFDTFKEQQKQYKDLLEGSKVSGWSHLTHASGRLHHSWSWACQDVGAAAVWMLP